MTPEKGQHVKCLLRGNTLAEGIVTEWGNNIVQLLSLDEQSILIIHHPQDDILLTKIILCDNWISKKDKDVPVQIKQTDLEQQFHKVYEEPSDKHLRLKKLAELRLMIAEQDKKIISDKLKEHHIGNVKEVKYGYPFARSK